MNSWSRLLFCFHLKSGLRLYWDWNLTGGSGERERVARGCSQGCAWGQLRPGMGQEGHLWTSLPSFALPPRHPSRPTAALCTRCVCCTSALHCGWDLYTPQLILTSCDWALSRFPRVVQGCTLPPTAFDGDYPPSPNFVLNDSFPSPLCGNGDAISFLSSSNKRQ